MILLPSHITKEVILMGVSALLVCVSVGSWVAIQITTKDTVYSFEPVASGSARLEEPQFAVDISGEVVHPGVYTLPSGSRIADVITLAGGLTDKADRAYIARAVNQARYISDQDKLHMPSIEEIRQGIFVEEPTVLEYRTSKTSEPISNTGETSSLISVNNAPAADLENLPGVGPKTVEKIIAGRPYRSISELLERKILTESLFQDINHLLGL